MKHNKIIEYLIDNLDRVMTLTENFIYPYKGFDIRKLYKNEYSYHRTIDRLEVKNYITKIPNDKFKLTLLGKLEILKSQNKKIDFDPKDWDGKWRIVAFDIPEKKRRVREKLREYLIILGFKPIQKSLWITPQKINFSELQPLFEKKIQEKLLFIEIGTLSEEEQLKKHFDFKDQ